MVGEGAWRGNLAELWDRLYPDETRELAALAADIEAALDEYRAGASRPAARAKGPDLVYSMYPDAFGGPDGQSSLDGAIPYLDELASMGVRTLWILPLLRSPGRDQGFDIGDYDHVDPAFGGDAAFLRFLGAAHDQGMRIVFDIAINHTSDEHPWFQAAGSGDPTYRDYYHWSADASGYALADIIFPGMVESNWTWHEGAGSHYFHRFYPFQPDLNYANPKVTREMVKALLRWKARGVDGFRMDAAPHLWKREGTDCNNQPETHLILKIFRAALDALEPGTILVAEASAQPPDLMPYFGEGDECRAAYHFPLMPRLWQALAEENPSRVAQASFPALPEDCSWFTFLRCHDEVTLDLVTPAERESLIASFMRHPSRLFRPGRAFSGRLFELLGRDPNRALLAFSLLFSVQGTPVIYYGDEIAMLDDEEFWKARTARTGFADSRFFHRGPFDAARHAEALADPGSDAGRVRHGLREMLAARRTAGELAEAEPELSAEGSVLRSVRRVDGPVPAGSAFASGWRRLEILDNLSARPIRAFGADLPPYGTRWTLS